MIRVAILVGSLRRESVNLKLAKAVAALAPQLQWDFVSLAELPIYNDDLWQNPPRAVIEFKERIRDSTALLFVTPEYNRSIPPVLKNAIDWGSRPKDNNVWAGKAGAVIGASPGTIGAAVAQSHLRYVAGIAGIAVLPQPEVYYSFKQDTISENFRFQKQETSDFILGFLAAFESWIDRCSRQR